MSKLPLDYERLVLDAIASESAVRHDRSNVVRVSEDVRVGNVLSLLSQSYVDSSGVPIPFIAAFLAVMDFNERKSTLVDNLQELTEGCDFYLSLLYRAPQYSPIQAGRYFQEEYLLRHNDSDTVRAMAVLGPTRSAESSIVAKMGGSLPNTQGNEHNQESDGQVSLNGIPNIASTATSAELEDRAEYPYFARTTPTNRVDAVALGWYLNSIGVRRLAVLHENDSFGKSYMMGLREVARKHSIQLHVVSYHLGLKDTLRGAIDSLLLANYTYHIFIPAGGFHTWYTLLFDLLDAYLIGVPDKTWFIGEGLHTYNGWLEPRLAQALNRTALVHVTKPEEQSRIMDFRVAHFLEDDELLEYFLSKQVSGPLADIRNLTQYRSEFYEMRPSDSAALMTYDAVMALGIAACETPEEFFTGPELYESLKNVRFGGASGEISFDNVTATRPFADVFITNIMVEPNGSSYAVESMVIDPANGHIETLNPLMFADGSTTPPPSLDPVMEDMNLIGLEERVTIMTLAGVVFLLSTGCAIWTLINRKKPRVRASQPIFLFTLTVGSFIIGCSIVPYTFQEPMSPRTLNAGCMLHFWLSTVGFSTCYGALFAKTRRIHLVVKESMRGRRIQVRVHDVLIPVVALLSTSVVILTCWTVVSPMTWERIPKETDAFGRTTSSIGTCRHFSDPAKIVFFWLTVGVNLAALCLANWMTYKARNLPSQFNDNPYIGMANVVILQWIILGIPILFLTTVADPSTFTVIDSLLLASIASATLIPVVLPFAIKPRLLESRRVDFIAGKKFIPEIARCNTYHYPAASPTDTHILGTRQVRVSGLPVMDPTSSITNCSRAAQGRCEIRTQSTSKRSQRSQQGTYGVNGLEQPHSSPNCSQSPGDSYTTKVESNR